MENEILAYKLKYISSRVSLIILCIIFPFIIVVMTNIRINVYAMENEYGFAGGNGSERSPFLIANANKLDNVRNYAVRTALPDGDPNQRLASGYYFKLTSDINMSDYLSEGNLGYNDGKGWLPIGQWAEKECSICDFTTIIETIPAINNGILSNIEITIIIVSSVLTLSFGGFAIFWFIIKKKKFADLIALIKKK